MPYNPSAHNRQTMRLSTWDYAGGAYFVTLCTHGRTCIFGDIADGEMRLSDAGGIAADEWVRSGELRPWITLDAFVVMPNHLHGIVLLHPPDEPDERASRMHTSELARPVRSLGSFIRGYKGAVTARINGSRGAPGMPVWQRNYYEHIIRNDHDLARICTYITTNPTRWDLDRENPSRPPDPRPPHP